MQKEYFVGLTVIHSDANIICIIEYIGGHLTILGGQK